MEVTPQIIGKYNQREQEQWEIEFALEVFELTNLEREKYGLPKFKSMALLTEVATTRAWETTVSFSHTRPDGTKFSTAYPGSLLSGGYYVGENIAAGQTSPEKVVQAWMNSEGHRANILDPDFEYLGIGFYYVNDGSYRYYWSQNFYTKY